MIQLAALLTKPFLGKRAPDAATDKMASVRTVLSGGSGKAWLPVARPATTLAIRGQTRMAAASSKRGECEHDGKPLHWAQFDWPADQQVDDCTLHRVCWRFYRNGLVSLELIASKDSAGLDTSDLVGHSIELRDRTGFLIGVWSAAFVVLRGADRLTFQASMVDDFLPLKLHFDEMGTEQNGTSFRI